MLRRTFEAACTAVSEHGAPESILWRNWLRVENDALSSPRRTENVGFPVLYSEVFFYQISDLVFINFLNNFF